MSFPKRQNLSDLKLKFTKKNLFHVTNKNFNKFPKLFPWLFVWDEKTQHLRVSWDGRNYFWKFWLRCESFLIDLNCFKIEKFATINWISKVWILNGIVNVAHWRGEIKGWILWIFKEISILDFFYSAVKVISILNEEKFYP